MLGFSKRESWKAGFGRLERSNPRAKSLALACLIALLLGLIGTGLGGQEIAKKNSVLPGVPADPRSIAFLDHDISWSGDENLQITETMVIQPCKHSPCTKMWRALPKTFKSADGKSRPVSVEILSATRAKGSGRGASEEGPIPFRLDSSDSKIHKLILGFPNEYLDLGFYTYTTTYRLSGALGNDGKLSLEVLSQSKLPVRQFSIHFRLPRYMKPEEIIRKVKLSLNGLALGKDLWTLDDESRLKFVRDPKLGIEPETVVRLELET